jgi:hypothetical protein
MLVRKYARLAAASVKIGCGLACGKLPLSCLPCHAAIQTTQGLNPRMNPGVTGHTSVWGGSA